MLGGSLCILMPDYPSVNYTFSPEFPLLIPEGFIRMFRVVPALQLLHTEKPQPSVSMEGKVYWSIKGMV